MKRKKKFGLVWEDKVEQVAEECKKKLPIVEEVPEKSLELAPNEPTSLIIEGDNYHALSVLNYTHAGKIDVIYIDPPYNTGKKDFRFNDNYVDEEDTYRHSKWLSFMKKRLDLAKSLLSPDGVIFIAIDDIEYANLKLLCDDIFGSRNFINNFMWLHGKGKKNKQSRTLQQYNIVYGKKTRDRMPEWSQTKDAQGSFSNPDNDPRGDWFSGSISFSESRSNKKHKNYFSITSPSGIVWTRQWMCSKEEMDEYLTNKKIYFGPSPNYNNTPRLKIFPTDTNEVIPDNILDNVGTTRSAQNDLDDIIGTLTNNKGKSVPKFENPKPISLIQHLLRILPLKNNAIILDFFAGSGTTGQAVLELNKEDGGHRQFILCTNNENHIAEDVTYPRIKTVITGKRADGSTYSDGIPANLRYFKTDFVEKDRSTDATREKLVDRSADMIRIRENAYEEYKATSINKYYGSKDAFVAIIFDPFAMTEAWDEIEVLNTEKKLVKLYIFSYSRDTSAFTDKIPETTLEWESIPIPESILQVYKRLFGGKK